MKKMWMGIIISLIIFPIAIHQANALIQYGSLVEMEISPGESMTFEWQLRSSPGDGSINLEIGSRGWGAEFFSYPDTLQIPEDEIGTLEITVTIPEDHPGGVILGGGHNLRVTATQLGEEGGSTIVNIRASKIVVLTILQNEDEKYWSNTAYDEPEKAAEPEVTIAETVEETPMEEKEVNF